MSSRCATVDDGLLEQILRCGRRDRRRSLLLYISVPVSDFHCASSARSCLAPEELFLLSTPWTSVGNASLSLCSLKVGPSKMPLHPKNPTQTQQLPNNQTCSSTTTNPHKLNNLKRSKQTHNNNPTKPNLKNNPQRQTHTISRMRMAIGFKAYL